MFNFVTNVVRVWKKDIKKHSLKYRVHDVNSILDLDQRTILKKNEFRTDAEFARSGYSRDITNYMDECYIPIKSFDELEAKIRSLLQA